MTYSKNYEGVKKWREAHPDLLNSTSYTQFILCNKIPTLENHQIIIHQNWQI